MANVYKPKRSDNGKRYHIWYCDFLDHTGRRRRIDTTGASLKVRMAIMRHSDKSNLTLGVYTHFGIPDLRAAVENLPNYPWPEKNMQKITRTGTDDA